MVDDMKLNETEWNQAVAFHMRIDKALRLASEMSFKGDFKGWLNAMLIFKRELQPWFSKDEAKDVDRLEIIARRNLGARNVSEILKYRSITELEGSLRMVFHRTGMDLPQKSDPRRALRG